MIRTKPSTAEYRDNYDKIFGKRDDSPKESDVKPDSYPKGRETDAEDKSTEK